MLNHHRYVVIRFQVCIFDILNTAKYAQYCLSQAL